MWPKRDVLLRKKEAASGASKPAKRLLPPPSSADDGWDTPERPSRAPGQPPPALASPDDLLAESAPEPAAVPAPQRARAAEPDEPPAPLAFGRLLGTRRAPAVPDSDSEEEPTIVLARPPLAALVRPSTTLRPPAEDDDEEDEESPDDDGEDTPAPAADVVPDVQPALDAETSMEVEEEEAPAPQVPEDPLAVDITQDVERIIVSLVAHSLECH
jgi:hypothetical protein